MYSPPPPTSTTTTTTYNTNTNKKVELMKAVTDSEMVQAMMGDVKVSKPGMQQALSQVSRGGEGSD
jgi:hypothetical protein